MQDHLLLRAPRYVYVAETATFPLMNGFVGTNEVRIRFFPPHTHSPTFIFSLLFLPLDHYPVLLLQIERSTHRNPIWAW
jgi:hypothetical protein